MSVSVKHAVRQRTQLGKPVHGTRIYAYNHIRTNQVVYSLDRVLDNTAILKQLPFFGKKSVPRALRKDHWKPFFVVKFGLPHQGLNAYKKLREWRKLHELSWSPEDVPQYSFTYPRQQEREERQRQFEELGGHRVGGARRRTEWKNRKKAAIKNQRANSVADLAAVLVEQEAKLAAWLPERQKLNAEIMTWLPELITDGEKRKARLDAINKEIEVLEKKVKDAKAATGNKWQLSVASRITNLNRDLKMKRTEYYQISHLPELFDLSPYAQSVIQQKRSHFEAMCEENFILHWQHQLLEEQMQKAQASSTVTSAELETMEKTLASQLLQLEDQATALKDLQAVELSDEATDSEIQGQRKDLRFAVQEIHRLRASINKARWNLLSTGQPPEWLKQEVFVQRAQSAVKKVLRSKPRLVGYLSRRTIADAAAQFSADADEAIAATEASPVSPSGETAPIAAATARDLRKKARASAIAAMAAESQVPSAPLSSADRQVTLHLNLHSLGSYTHTATWLSIFPDFFARYLSTLTAVAPKPSSELRLSDVSIEWADPLDAEYGAEWPAEVTHAPMGVVRHAAPSERFAPRRPDADAYPYTAQGRPLPAVPQALVPELQQEAERARAHALVANANDSKQRRNLALAAAYRAERDRLKRVLERHVRGPVGKAIHARAKEELAALEASRLPAFGESEEVQAARETVGELRRVASVKRRRRTRRAQGMGHYGVVGLREVSVAPVSQ